MLNWPLQIVCGRPMQVLIQSQTTASALASDRFGQVLVIRILSFAMPCSMINVNGKRGELQIATLNANVVEPGGNLIVLATPADHALIESIHLDQVRPPACHVATANCFLIGTLAGEHERAKQPVANRMTTSFDMRREETDIEKTFAQYSLRHFWLGQ